MYGGCPANCSEMTRRHNKVVNVVKKAVDEQIINKIHSGIG
jgi:hypothetical protein